MEMAKTQAVIYLRVSGKGQVDGTGFDRQMDTALAYAKKADYRVIKRYKEAHTGTEIGRPIFNEMLQDLLSNGCRIVIVESLDRLARDLSIQMQLLAILITGGITLVAASTGRDITADMQSDPMLKAMVQVQGVFAELDKSLLVRKLAKARELRRKQTGRCEGRKPFGTRPGEAEVIERMKHLYRKPRKGNRLGHHQIALQLNEESRPTRTGKPWSAVTVKRVLERV